MRYETFELLEYTFGINSVVLFLLFLHFSKGIRLFTQGVLKIRKKVTLMVVTVSAIFEISWGTHSILHVLDDIGSYKLNPFAIPISHVMLMFNSAVNPFAYALINQRFREKINRLIFCCSSRVHAAREFEGIEMRNKNTNVQAPGPSSRQ